MALTPRTLTRHELRGLPVRVTAAASDAHVGLAGVVVEESMRTLTVRTPRGDKCVPKEGTSFRFVLTPAPRTAVGAGAPAAGPTDEAAGVRKAPGSASELPSPAPGTLAAGDGQYDTAGVEPGQSDGCEGAVSVTVEGARLLSRPAFRTERAGDHTWQSD